MTADSEQAAEYAISRAIRGESIHAMHPGEHDVEIDSVDVQGFEVEPVDND